MAITVAEMTIHAGEEIDKIDEAIDNLAQQSATVAYDERTTAQSARAMELLNEAQAGPGSQAIAQLKHRDVWTLDSMSAHEPISVDVYEDGRWIIKVMPVLGNTYCQKRLGRSDDVDAKVPGAYLRLQIGYCEIVYELLRKPGCDWGLAETEQDEQGNDILVEQTIDGVQVMLPKTHPLPITMENIERLDMSQLIAIIDGTTKKLQGEASGKPS